MSFLEAQMSAARLGLKPNTPLGQAYLIPYKNKGVLECQFQIEYKRLLDLVYPNDIVQTVQAQTTYEHDEFRYSLGLNSELIHIPALSDRGEAVAFYTLFKLDNSGYGFEVMSRSDMEKIMIKLVLKLAPLKSDFQCALSSDGTVKTELAVNMSEVVPEDIINVDGGEVAETSNK